MCKDEFNGCPMCNNQIGFSFGTCSECGYNYLEKEFKFIKVHVDYLPKEVKHNLITMHGKKYNKKFKAFEEDWFTKRLKEIESIRDDEHLYDFEY